MDKKNWHKWIVVYWLGIIRLVSSSYYLSPTICSVFGWKCWQAYFISFLVDSYPYFLTIYMQLLCGTSFILVAHCISNKPKIVFEVIWLFHILYVHYLNKWWLIHFLTQFAGILFFFFLQSPTYFFGIKGLIFESRLYIFAAAKTSWAVMSILTNI